MAFSMIQMQTPLFAQQLRRSLNVTRHSRELRSIPDPGRYDQHLVCVGNELTPVMLSAGNDTLHSTLHVTLPGKLHTKLLRIAEPDCSGAIICNSGN